MTGYHEPGAPITIVLRAMRVISRRVHGKVYSGHCLRVLWIQGFPVSAGIRNGTIISWRCGMTAGSGFLAAGSPRRRAALGGRCHGSRQCRAGLSLTAPGRTRRPVPGGSGPGTATVACLGALGRAGRGAAAGRGAVLNGTQDSGGPALWMQMGIVRQVPDFAAGERRPRLASNDPRTPARSMPLRRH